MPDRPRPRTSQSLGGSRPAPLPPEKELPPNRRVAGSSAPSLLAKTGETRAPLWCDEVPELALIKCRWSQQKRPNPTSGTGPPPDRSYRGRIDGAAPTLGAAVG